MELREFVKNSLLDILGGIKDAQAEVQKHDGSMGVVNPKFEGHGLTVSTIKFDVAVTTASTTSGKASGGINVYAAKVGGASSTEDTNSAVSRLNFGVPYVAPTVNVTNVRTATVAR